MDYPDLQDEFPPLLSWILPSNLLMLESIEVMYPSDVDLSTVKPTRMFGLAPALHTVQLKYGFPIEGISLQWVQLRHIRFSDPIYNDMHNLLRLCTHVETASFTFCRWDYGDPSDIWYTHPSAFNPVDSTPYTTNLEELTFELIHEEPSIPSMAIFSFMTAPRMRVAHIRFRSLNNKHRPKEDPDTLSCPALVPLVTSFIDMVQRSKSPITNLSLGDLPFTSHDLLRLFTLTPNLTILDVDRIPTFSSDIFEQMTPPSDPARCDSGILLPVLSRLSIENQEHRFSGKADSEKVLQRMFWMLESRSRGLPDHSQENLEFKAEIEFARRTWSVNSRRIRLKVRGISDLGSIGCRRLDAGILKS
jgi:hypothetical protein